MPCDKCRLLNERESWLYTYKIHAQILKSNVLKFYKYWLFELPWNNKHNLITAFDTTMCITLSHILCAFNYVLSAYIIKIKNIIYNNLDHKIQKNAGIYSNQEQNKLTLFKNKNQLSIIGISQYNTGEILVLLFHIAEEIWIFFDRRL